ncbi:MAG: DMT family transporter [Rhodobacteraceae bacterium]|nr:DMT family transporter [Paracoccaceae bacterium]
MTETAKSNLKGALLSLLAYGIFSTHDVFIKTLGAYYAPFQIIFFSVLLSLPLLMFMLMRDETKANLIPVHPWWSALRTGSVLITGSSAFYAFSTLPLAQTYAILFAAPLVITVLSIPILGERVGLFRWAAVLIGLVGVIVVIRPGAVPLELGHFAAMAAAFFGALASIVVRKIGREERSAVLLLYPLMANFVVMACILPFVYVPMPFAHFGMVAIVAVLAFIAGLVVIAAYKAGDAAIVAPMQYSQIIWAAAYGALIFGEYPDTYTFAGAGIIILSGLVVVLRETLSGKSINMPVLSSRPRPETGASPRQPLKVRPRSGDLQ